MISPPGEVLGRHRGLTAGGAPRSRHWERRSLGGIGERRSSSNTRDTNKRSALARELGEEERRWWTLGGGGKGRGQIGAGRRGGAGCRPNLVGEEGLMSRGAGEGE